MATRKKRKPNTPSSVRPSTSDVEDIISGKPIPIDIRYPLSDLGSEMQPEETTDEESGEEGEEKAPEKKTDPVWYMKQPDDWLYDMAISVQEAAAAKMMQEPEIALAKELPPSDAWIGRRDRQEEQYRERVAELEALPSRTMQDDLELFNLGLMLNQLWSEKDYNRAQELSDDFGMRRRDFWLMRRLVTDKHGDLLLTPDTDEGEERWRCIGRDAKEKLRRYVWNVIRLVQLAKNSKADLSSS